MMREKTVKEYKILPQTENERFYQNLEASGRHTDDSSVSYKSKPCCVSSLILVTVLFIVAGTSAIIISFWWSAEFHTALDKYWPGHPGFTSTHPAADGNESTPDYYNGNGTTSGETAYGSGETYSGEGSSTEEFNSTYVSPEAAGDGHGNGSGLVDTDDINEKNVGAKFAEAMRKFEKEMEKISGIHQAELVIPLFMLVTLMSTLALISFCCCLMSKRREKRQRKLLGKFITDLQSGDSKTILLGNDSDY